MIYPLLKNSIAVCIFFFSLTIFSQKIWLNENWNETSKEKALFYRTKAKKLSDVYEVAQFYKSGKLLLQGLSKSAKPSKEDFDGLVKVYFETGEIKEERFYLNGKREGIWKTYHKSGKIKTKGKYRDGEKVGVWKTFYKNVY